MRCKAQTAAILGVSRRFVSQQRTRQMPQKFKLIVEEHLLPSAAHPVTRCPKDNLIYGTL